MAFAYDISRLVERKMKRGLSDLDIARVSRLHPSTVKNVLTGRTQKPNTVGRVALALGMDLADIVVATPEDAA